MGSAVARFTAGRVPGRDRPLFWPRPSSSFPSPAPLSPLAPLSVRAFCDPPAARPTKTIARELSKEAERIRHSRFYPEYDAALGALTGGAARPASALPVSPADACFDRLEPSQWLTDVDEPLAIRTYDVWNDFVELRFLGAGAFATVCLERVMAGCEVEGRNACE